MQGIVRCSPGARARRHSSSRSTSSPGPSRNADVRRLELAWAASNFASRASAVAVAVYAYEADGVGAVGIVVFLRLAVAGACIAVALRLRRPSTAPARHDRVGSRPLPDARCDGAPRGVSMRRSLSVYVLAVLVAVAEPVFRSAQAALTPSLVKTPEELTAANVVASAVESVGLFLGPALGSAPARRGGHRDGVRRRPVCCCSCRSRSSPGSASRASRRRSRASRGRRQLLAGWRGDRLRARASAS